MNAKNDTPPESEATKPAAKPATEASATSSAAAAEQSAETPVATPAATPAVKPTKARAKKSAEPAAKATNATAEKQAKTPAAEPATPAVDTAPPAVDATAPAAETVPPGADAAAPVDETAATGEVASAAAPVQTVYVTAPTPPKPKGNRIIGSLLAIVATIVFAAVFAGVVAILIQFGNATILVDNVVAFVGSARFLIPVLVFLVAMILWALIANRASWWSWVIGSLIIAAITYFASVGILILLVGGFALTASETSAYFVGYALNPALIAAALIARECAIWFGAAIAKRGRKVRERNYAAWQAFENEEALKRAEFGGTAAA